MLIREHMQAFVVRLPADGVMGQPRAFPQDVVCTGCSWERRALARPRSHAGVWRSQGYAQALLWGCTRNLSSMFTRPMFDALRHRLAEPRRFFQVLVGPRQTGKTTLARQLIEAIALPSHYASARAQCRVYGKGIRFQWDDRPLLA